MILCDILKYLPVPLYICSSWYTYLIHTILDWFALKIETNRDEKVPASDILKRWLEDKTSLITTDSPFWWEKLGNVFAFPGNGVPQSLITNQNSFQYFIFDVEVTIYQRVWVKNTTIFRILIFKCSLLWALVNKHKIFN